MFRRNVGGDDREEHATGRVPGWGTNVGEEWAQRMIWEIRVMKALSMSSPEREG